MSTALTVPLHVTLNLVIKEGCTECHLIFTVTFHDIITLKDEKQNP